MSDIIFEYDNDCELSVKDLLQRKINELNGIDDHLISDDQKIARKEEIRCLCHILFSIEVCENNQ